MCENFDMTSCSVNGCWIGSTRPPQMPQPTGAGSLSESALAVEQRHECRGVAIAER